MEKIPTIFERNWDGDRKVIPKFIPQISAEILALDRAFTPTEKIDGMNIRLTIRAGRVMRIEKRRNPTKAEKAQGVKDPWYKDTDEYGPEDKHLLAAVRGRTYDSIPDGEWSGEAIGPNIQGNPLGLAAPTVYLFSCGEAIPLDGVPTDYEGLKAWLPTAKSRFPGATGNIEGVVWHGPGGEMYKIKTKDF